jgi:hypothetical protein
MKNEIIVDGIKYRKVEEELTLLNCTQCNSFSTYRDDINNDLPTESIAEKVLLYGLLQSVANKLNGDWRCWPLGNVFGYEIIRKPQTNELYVVSPGSYNGCGVRFQSRELAEQAIRIFKNSKFDLKKLFQ